MEFEGSRAGILKNLKKMKVLGGVAGRRRESLQGGETARPGSNIVENVRFGRQGALLHAPASCFLLSGSCEPVIL